MSVSPRATDRTTITLDPQALEQEEAEVYQTKEEILRQSQRLSATFLEQKSELEGSVRVARETASTADSKAMTLQRELDVARCGSISI